MAPETRNEDTWFAHHEEELLRQARRERDRRMREAAASEEAGRERVLRERHWMKCPKCGHDLKAVSLSGVDLGQCTHCEGVFFDRDNLETFVLKRVEERRSFVRRFLGFGA
jgi:uncharacterized protein